MNKIGLVYDDNIFQTKTKEYKFKQGIVLSHTERPETYDRIQMRTWQLNQPFQNMNNDVNIPDELDKLLKESPIVRELGYFDPINN